MKWRVPVLRSWWPLLALVLLLSVVAPPPALLPPVLAQMTAAFGAGAQQAPTPGPNETGRPLSIGEFQQRYPYLDPVWWCGSSGCYPSLVPSFGTTDQAASIPTAEPRPLP
jgi:hypothetical protein